MKISLKFIEICSKHIFVWLWRFFSGLVLIVLKWQNKLCGLKSADAI